ncbi:peptide ABC transporter substrate-binding protein [Arthrobacter sp. StoSoilB13]|nr:peptide ABC transporter substrate-binding protein [Arthrobacter sp. StoSoilB13]
MMVGLWRVWPGRRGRSWRWAAAAVVGVVGVGVLAGCDGGAAKSSSASDTLTVAINGEYPTSFELNAQCSSPIFQLTYEPLIRVSSSGGYEPGIAESWEYSESNTVFTMKIHSGIKFADGTDVTAKSVVDTLNYYKSVPGVNDGYIKPWKVEAKGSDSVQITSEQPFLGVEQVLSDNGNCNNGMIISEAGLKDPAKLKTQMFGAGPYEYVADESEPGDHYAFKPRQNYYDKSRQNYKKIVLRVIADPNTALSALATGQVQVDMTGGTSLVAQARSQGFDATVQRNSAAAVMLWDRGGETTKPLGDVRVRQAMALALDRDLIAKAVGPEAKPADQFTLEGFPGYDANLSSKYTYDVDKAKALMSEAGYADGFSMTMITNSDDTAVNTAVGAAVDQLAKIGVKIDLKSIAGLGFWTDMATKQYSAGAVSYGLYGIQPLEAYRLYKLPYSAVWNPFTSVDPDIESAYESLMASSESDFEKNAKQFNETISSKVWYLPIVNTPHFVYSKGVDIGTPEPMGNFAVSAWKPKG